MVIGLHKFLALRAEKSRASGGLPSSVEQKKAFRSGQSLPSRFGNLITTWAPYAE